jgi:hypothetical protein
VSAIAAALSSFPPFMIAADLLSYLLTIRHDHVDRLLRLRHVFVATIMSTGCCTFAMSL